MSDERLNNLESKLAHQEVLLEELHQVLYEQQKTIDKMDKALTTLTQRLKDVLQGEDIRGHEKPPHY